MTVIYSFKAVSPGKKGIKPMQCHLFENKGYNKISNHSMEYHNQSMILMNNNELSIEKIRDQ